MRYVYWTLIALAIIVIVTLIVCLIVHYRRKWACKKVKSLCTEVKIRQLDEALEPFGFVYERQGDLIGSRMYPWQREMGYCRKYDEAAPAMFMIFDSEPIYFDCDGKRWLLEMWKGQYGCTTGGEIGLYVNETAGMSEDPEKLFYKCADDDSRLNMHFILLKNGKVVMERKELHWWLTGFLVGEYSEKEQLSMEVRICFCNVRMRNAFYEGLIRAGYKPEEIRVDQCCVTLFFDRPKTCQPHHCCKCRIRWICRRNRKNCKLYRKVTKCFCTTLDKISYLGYCFPRLYRLLMRMGTKCTHRKLKKFMRKAG